MSTIERKYHPEDWCKDKHDCEDQCDIETKYENKESNKDKLVCESKHVDKPANEDKSICENKLVDKTTNKDKCDHEKKHIIKNELPKSDENFWNSQSPYTYSKWSSL